MTLLDNFIAFWNRLGENKIKLNRDISRLEGERDRLTLVNQKLDLEIEVKQLTDSIEEKRKQID